MKDIASKFGLLHEPTQEERTAGIIKGQAFWNTTSPVLPIFEEFFGSAPRCNVCAIGIEPNPRHAPRLKTLEKALNTAGASVIWLTEKAASTSNGVAYVDLKRGGGEVNDVGLSIRQSAQWPSIRMTQKTVSTVDLADVIREVHALLQDNVARSSVVEKGHLVSRMVMKLDVEGEEYNILPRLLAEKSLCHLDLIFLEWHDTHSRARERKSLVKRLEDSSSEGCRPFISAIDDETFMFDGQPDPSSNVCKSAPREDVS